MRIVPTAIADARVIEFEAHADHRGLFGRVWCEDEFAAAGREIRFVQANTGFSPVAGTLRGLHLQRSPHEEWKLVRCTRGSVFDVIVDLRSDSETYRHWHGVRLNADDRRSVLVPPGCAHGYQTLQPSSELFYMTSCRYEPTAVTGVRFDDPVFSIEWPLPPGPISEGDLAWPAWSEHDERAQRREA